MDAAELPSKEVRELIARAELGDRSAVPAVKRAFDDDPTLWQTVGDLAAQVQERWLGVVAGTDFSLKESVRRKMDELKEQLAGAAPTPIEKLLVDRVVACWLQVYQADSMYANAILASANESLLRVLMRRQESSQRQFLASIKQLDLVRGLTKPRLSVFSPAGTPATEPRHGQHTKKRRFAGAH